MDFLRGRVYPEIRTRFQPLFECRTCYNNHQWNDGTASRPNKYGDWTGRTAVFKKHWMLTSLFLMGIVCPGKIKDVVKRLWTPKDTVEFLKNKSSFDLELSGGQIRTLEIKTSKKCEYSIDLRINGQRDARKILVLGTNVHVNNIPFSLD